ncbi:MAG: hypothetical protein JWO48_596, partial [Bryobacterales bacterium]|nr:hypothetical protein [Bryobacterales bacterium]
LGVSAAMGRTYTPEDAEPGHDDVVVLSDGLWQRQFGGAKDIIGKKLVLNGQTVTVIGVMPPDFKWFVEENSLVGKPAELWTPTKLVAQTPRARGRYLSAVARLKAGVTSTQAQTELSGIAYRLEQQYPQSNTGWDANVVPVREQFVGKTRTALLVLLGAVGFVLLIACANVGNLVLARAASRQKELAIRAAMGAGRWRLTRQLITESVLLSAGGGALGLLIPMWGIDALVSLSPQNLIGLDHVGVSLPVLGFTFGVSLLTGVLFGFIPALDASRFDPNEALKETGKSNTGNPRSRGVRNLFVITEMALALVLLVAAGLMIKSFFRLQAVDPGFDAKNLLTMRVLLPDTKYKEDNQRVAFFRNAVEQIEKLPGVSSASAISFLPFADLGAATGFTIEGRPAPAAGQGPVTDVRVTDEKYFQTMNIPVLAGRTFNVQEATEDRHVIVINETLARKYFQGENPLGKRLLVSMKAVAEPTEVIGVVGDAKYDKLEGEPRAMIYWAHPQLGYSGMTIIARTAGEPMSLAPAAQRVIQSIDPDQPVSDVRTMESWIGNSVARARFGTVLLALFGVVALMLAAIGIYGVISYSVTQRTHEIGIRMALGAKPGDVLRMVIKQGMAVSVLGIALGIVGAFAATRVLASMLYEVAPTDPLTFVSIPLLLSLVALLASYIPARRATKVDPMEALRYE